MKLNKTMEYFKLKYDNKQEVTNVSENVIKSAKATNENLKNTNAKNSNCEMNFGKKVAIGILTSALVAGGIIIDGYFTCKNNSPIIAPTIQITEDQPITSVARPIQIEPVTQPIPEELTTIEPTTEYQTEPTTTDESTTEALYDQIYDVESFETCDDFYLISKALPGDYVDNNQMYFENSTISVSINENVKSRNVSASLEAVKFYQNLFSVINPNIKIELKNEYDENSDVRIFEKDEDLNGKTLMVTQYYYAIDTDENGSKIRRMPNQKTNKDIIFWELCDSISISHLEKTVLHEFLHVFGINDHEFENSEKHIGNDDVTIMNYSNLESLASISPDQNKITPSDYLALVKLYSPFANHENSGINNEIMETENWHNEQEYNDYIESRMADFCYSQKELDLVDDCN